MDGWKAMRWAALALVATLLAALPAAGSQERDVFVSGLADTKLRLPFFTPKNLSPRLRQVIERRESAARGSSTRPAGAGGIVFNDDDFGLPQNEESVSVCKQNTRYVLEGTNDYRGLLDPAGNFTGWHFSKDGGRSLKNEGLLPPVSLLSDDTREVPSGGDPVKVFGLGCAAFAGGLAYDPFDPFSNPNGIAIYKSNPATLASCDTSVEPANPACWPVRRLVAEGAGSPDPTPDEPGHFLDKPWFDVGWSGDAEYVWVAYSDFTVTGPGELDFTASIFAVRCDTDLVTCTEPLLISGDDADVQFADVTIGPDGRVYITWSQIIGELEDEPQTFVHKLRVAEPGATTFGPVKVVHVEEQPIPFGGFLNADDFRVATYPKNAVAPNKHGGQRIFVVWDACRYRPLPSVCEEAHILLKWSDNQGDTWKGPVELSRGGNNYFPSIDWNDSTRDPMLAFTWFSSRRDWQFDNRQDVEFLGLDADRPWDGGKPERLTKGMNEPEADPLLGGFFIGDYIEVSAFKGRAWVGYNANYRQVELLGDGVPVPQQDNYLVITGLDD